MHSHIYKSPFTTYITFECASQIPIFTIINIFAIILTYKVKGFLVLS